MIRQAKNSKSLASIGQPADIRQSTVPSIANGKDKIKDHVQNAGQVQISLKLWIEDQHKKKQKTLQ
jgi:hypothetical protein